jgi:hypothetical protein
MAQENSRDCAMLAPYFFSGAVTFHALPGARALATLRLIPSGDIRQ